MRTFVAKCSTQLITSPAAEFRLVPAGSFKAVDGRPHGLDGWTLYADAALQIVRHAANRKSDFVIDYEHQTLATKTNGQPAPAAGWFKRLEWRDGDGLYVMDARWTERGAEMIRAKEYRFISPVFTYDKTGRVIDVLHAALTNNPALDGLTELAAASRRLAGDASPDQIVRAALSYQDTMAKTGAYVSTVSAIAHVAPAKPSLSANQTHSPAHKLAAAAIAYQETMEKLGTHVPTAQAVSHVLKSE